MDDSTAARRETIRYHDAVYQQSDPAAAGWLSRPHPLVVNALALVTEPVHAYDLGAGIGRHTLLLARELSAGSRVTAVDLLPSALDRLTDSAIRAGLEDRINTLAADLETYRFPADDAGLIVAFSVVEHLSCLRAMTLLLTRCRDATRPGGINVIAIFADRQEVTALSTRRALVESWLTSHQARDTLLHAYRGWEIILDASYPTAVSEMRDGEAYQLRATCVTVVARRPSSGQGRVHRFEPGADDAHP